MDKDNKYYSLIEKLVREHKKFPGYEAIIEDIIDDVFSHSEVVINSIDNESVIKSYLEKVISTSIITVPKKLNYNSGVRHRVIAHSAENPVKEEEKTDTENSMVLEEPSPTIDLNQVETIEPVLSDDALVDISETELESTDVADLSQDKANTELVDRMINSIDSDSIKADLYSENNEDDDVINLLQDDTVVDIEENEIENIELSADEELINEESDEYAFTDSSEDIQNLNADDGEDNIISIDSNDDADEENSELSFIDTLKQTQTDYIEENAELEEELDNNNSLSANDDTDNKNTEEEGEIIEFSDDIDTPEFEPLNDEIELSEEQGENSSELSENEEVENIENINIGEVDELEETEVQSDLVDTSIGLFETTYKYEENDSEPALSSDENVELNEVEFNNDELNDDTLESEEDAEAGFFHDDSGKNEGLSVASDESELIEDNEQEELTEESDLSLEYDDISLNDDNIEVLAPIDSIDEELSEEFSDDNIGLTEVNEGIELLDSENSENEVEDAEEIDLSGNDMPQDYFENIQLVEDYDPHQIRKSSHSNHKKTIDFSIFNFEPKADNETFDTEILSDKILELNDNKPELNILNIFEMRYKQKLSIEDIASDLGINKKDVIDALNTIMELV